MAYGDNPYAEPIDEQTAELISLYSAEMGIPEDRFGVLDGRLMFVNSGGGYEEVDPSLLQVEPPTIEDLGGGDPGVPSLVEQLGKDGAMGGVDDNVTGTPQVTEVPNLSKKDVNIATTIGGMVGGPALAGAINIGAGFLGFGDGNVAVTNGSVRPDIGTGQWSAEITAGDRAEAENDARDRDARSGYGGYSGGPSANSGPGPAGVGGGPGVGGDGGQGGQNHDRGVGGEHGGGTGGFHEGGPVTDNNPATYQNDMPANVQEGEFVMSRSAVEFFGQDYLQKLNDSASGKTGMRSLRRI